MLCILATLPATRCGTGPDPRSSGSGGAAPNDAGVLASAINVTPFEVTVVLSGVLDDAVDTVERTIASRDSTDVDFVCVDELAVGDPLEPEAPGVVIAADDEAQEVEAFSVFLDEAFFCGDVVEIIISGNDAETFAVDVFAFTPP
ncbi:MAG: hypothetical protein GY778_24190 [bacterium]|nr:hypothetical protein [bacterium]